MLLQSLPVLDMPGCKICRRLFGEYFVIGGVPVFCVLALAGLCTRCFESLNVDSEYDLRGDVFEPKTAALAFHRGLLDHAHALQNNDITQGLLLH